MKFEDLNPDTRWLVFGICGILGIVVFIGLVGYATYSLAELCLK